jgi:hypothetical protein
MYYIVTPVEIVFESRFELALTVYQMVDNSARPVTETKKYR